MTKEIFKNLPDTSTPLSASKLNGLFDGEESMGSIVIEDITCKNILPTDVGNWEQGAISNGVNGTSTTRIRTNCFIPIKANTEYYVSVQNKNYSFLNIHYYDTNKNFVTDAYNSYSQINGATGLAIKTPSGVAFARVVLRNADNTTTITASEVSSIKPMIEKGSVGTNYVEHKEFYNEQNYSENERMVGKYYDGHTIFQKTFYGASDNYGYLWLGSIPNLDVIIGCEGFFLETDSKDCRVFGSNNMQVVQKGTTGIEFYSNTNTAGWVSMTIKYLKTTN